MTNIMDKFTQFLEEKLMPVAGKVANQRHLAAIKDGMVITLPFIIVGSVFLILGNLPIPALANFYKYNAVGQIIAKWLSYPVDVTFNLLLNILIFLLIVSTFKSFSAIAVNLKISLALNPNFL